MKLLTGKISQVTSLPRIYLLPLVKEKPLIAPIVNNF